jgi:hypothetical protein
MVVVLLFEQKSWPKVNMPISLLGFCEASKVKTFLLKMDDNYDVQKPEVDHKVAIADSFLKKHVFVLWINNKVQEPKVVANLI